MVTAIKGSPTSPQPVGGIRYCEGCLAIYRQDFRRCPLDGEPLVIGAADPWIGRSVGSHYVVDGFVGEGAMGRVYRAHHRDIPDRRYAIKILIGDLAATAQMRTRFQLEAEHASKLAHPNVVGVIDYGTTDRGVSYIVMDLVEGPSLGSILLRGPMAPERVIKLARQLCDALDHAHGRGMIHRDLKPDNILVVGDGAFELARVADFGLALSVDTAVRLTTTGIVCTPAYAAPEQLRGHAIDHRVDLYALGTTMYEMLSGGLLPFAGDLDTSVRSKLMNDAPSILMVAPNVPPVLVSIVGRLLASDPSHRPHTARAVMRALDGALDAPRAVRNTLSMRPTEPCAPLVEVDAGDSSKLPNKAAPVTARIDTRGRRPVGRSMIQLFACGVTLGGALAWFGLRGRSDVEPAFTAPSERAAAAFTALGEPAPLALPGATLEVPLVMPALPTFASTVATPDSPGFVASYTPTRLPVEVEQEIVEPTIEPAPKQPAKRPVRAAPATASVSDRTIHPEPDDLARRYGSIARDLKQLDVSLGRENTDDLWTVFRTIRILDAMRSQSTRDEAAATLATIADAISDRSPP